MLEAAVGNLKLADGRDHMSRHFRLLALQALSGPAADVAPHVGPHHFGLNHLPCSLDAGMAESVEDVKDLPAKCGGNIWPCWAVASVDDE